MEKVLDMHEAWWNGTSDTPLIEAVVTDAYNVPKKAVAPVLDQATCADFSYSAEQLVERIDEELSAYEFLGAGYPRMTFVGFGPGILAAMCGGRLDNSSGRVWFYGDYQHIEDIHPVYDPDSVWARRIKDIYRVGLERWQGSVLMEMPDLGGAMDVAASLRGSENLLLDLYDAPEEVERLTGEIETAWHAAYADFEQALAPQKGYSSWSGIASRKRYYIVQCDFCYMIGNPMFRRFVLPTIRRDTEKLSHTIYHLDGIGQLRHLDDLLTLPKLNAVQWVSGDGQPDGKAWLDVYKKIDAAGKRSWVVGGARDFLDVRDAIRAPFFRFQITGDGTDDDKKVLKML